MNQWLAVETIGKRNNDGSYSPFPTVLLNLSHVRRFEVSPTARGNNIYAVQDGVEGEEQIELWVEKSSEETASLMKLVCEVVRSSDPYRFILAQFGENDVHAGEE